ncbi:MAG TPA: DUF2461 family protein [Bacillota bacterium]|nr:DUF2461 family protein [Bacillota bacterium]
MLDRFHGFSPETFAFFSGLAADNTRAWFQANRATFLNQVDTPWRSFLTVLASELSAAAPELDCVLRPGRVLSRPEARWPRPDAAYRTDAAASFRPAGSEAAPRLMISLQADGLRAGLEASPRTPAWRALAQAAAAAPPPDGMSWRSGWRPVPHRGPAATSSLRLVRLWPAEAAVAAGAEMAGEVMATLRAVLPWYRLAAHGDAARLPTAAPDLSPEPAPNPAQAPEPAPNPARVSELPPAPAPHPALEQAAAPAAGQQAGLLAGLPQSLRARIQARAAAEGVAPAVFVVYALTRAAEG